MGYPISSKRVILQARFIAFIATQMLTLVKCKQSDSN
jgi:hypothetical protein